MKKTVMVYFLTMMFIFISTVCTASDVVVPSPPKMTLGDVFVYQGFNDLDDAKRGHNPIWTARNTVTEVNGDEGFVMSTKRAIKHYNRDGNLTKRERENKPTIVYSPFWSTYRYPMKVGDKYSVKFTHTWGNMGDANFSLSIKVVGWETITVPAGTFEALRVEARGTYEHPPNYVTADITYTTWLAPAVKMRSILYDEARSWDGGSEYFHESLKKFIPQ